MTVKSVWFHRDPIIQGLRNACHLTSPDQRRARDVAQVRSRHFQHSPHTSAQHHFRGRQREAHDLRPANVRRYRQRVGIGDEVDEGRPRMVERVLERSPTSLGCSTLIAWMPAAWAIAA